MYIFVFDFKVEALNQFIINKINRQKHIAAYLSFHFVFQSQIVEEFDFLYGSKSATVVKSMFAPPSLCS